LPWSTCPMTVTTAGLGSASASTSAYTNLTVTRDASFKLAGSLVRYCNLQRTAMRVVSRLFVARKTYPEPP